MTFALNTATLVGRVSKYGLKLKDGTATGALAVVEEGRDGKPHTAFVNVHIWGKEGAPQASAMPPGSLVLVQGQIRPKHVDNRWTLLIAAREVQLLEAATKEEYATESTG